MREVPGSNPGRALLFFPTCGSQGPLCASPCRRFKIFLRPSSQSVSTSVFTSYIFSPSFRHGRLRGSLPLHQEPVVLRLQVSEPSSLGPTVPGQEARISACRGDALLAFASGAQPRLKSRPSTSSLTPGLTPSCHLGRSTAVKFRHLSADGSVQPPG